LLDRQSIASRGISDRGSDEEVSGEGATGSNVAREAKVSLWSSIFDACMEGFALYGASIYPAGRFPGDHCGDPNETLPRGE
jgi:hypothetical protein